MKNLIRKITPSFFLSWYHFLLALLGAILYGFPSRRLKVIGVTGTKGKSTVVELAGQILKEAGYKIASISSIRFKIGDKEWLNDLKMTMPGRLKLQRFLKEAVDSGCQYAIIEVTSEGILQHRHRFIDFDVVVFTNLSPEHIERHGSFEKYREAKGKLFQACSKVHILNLDDENVNYFLKFKAERKFSFSIFRDQISLKGPALVIRASDIKERTGGVSFKVEGIEFNLHLFGEFNIYNALAAICIGLSQEASLGVCKRALERTERIAGRMEAIIERPFKVIVDYAHTPDSLEKVYQTLTHQLINSSTNLCFGSSWWRQR